MPGAYPMTDAVVVDASVAVKWLFDEDYSAKADALLRAGAEEYAIFAPPILPSEITNAVYKRFRQKAITLAAAERALLRFLEAPVELLAPEDLYASALKLAAQYDLGATYDAQYLALARALDAEFWTADMKLVRAVSEPWVRWIGDHPATAPT